MPGKVCCCFHPELWLGIKLSFPLHGSRKDSPLSSVPFLLLAPWKAVPSLMGERPKIQDLLIFLSLPWVKPSDLPGGPKPVPTEGGWRSLWEMSPLIPGRRPSDFSGHCVLVSQELLQSTGRVVQPSAVTLCPTSLLWKRDSGSRTSASLTTLL